MTSEQTNQGVEKLMHEMDVEEADKKRSLIERARNETKDYGLIGMMSLAVGAYVCATNYQNLKDEINGYAILIYDKIAGITPSPEIFDGRYDGMCLPAVIATGIFSVGALWCANSKRKEAKRLEDELKNWSDEEN